MRRALYAAVMLIVAASPIQTLRCQELGDARLDRESARTVQALTDSARAEGLPAKSLTAVLQEGLSQHASGTRITRAMQDYLRALRGAAAALGASSTEPELVSGAGALLAGVPSAALTQIRAARGKETVVVPLVVLGDLVARGVAARAAGAAIADATRRGIPDREFNMFREQVETAIASGATASAALESATRGVLTTPPAAADSVARRRKPPLADPEGYARVELDQSSGGPTVTFRELRADAFARVGARTPFAFAADVRALDGGLLQAPGALVNTAVLATAATPTSGVAAGLAARLISLQGASSGSLSVQAKAWDVRGPWTFSANAAFGAVPAWSASASTVLRVSSVVDGGGGGRRRLDVTRPESSVVSVPRGTPSSGDSTSQQFSDLTSSAAAEARFAIDRIFGRLVVEGSAGIRSYSPSRSVTWSSVSAAMALTDGVRVVAGGTVGAENPLLPTGSSRLFAGVRFATGRSLASPPRESVEGEVAEFRIVRAGATSTIEIRARGARSVEVVGDFTDWIPLTLSTSDGERWSTTRAIEPGVYRVRVRIDGAAWKPPHGIPCSVDAFGGETGMMTVGVS